MSDLTEGPITQPKEVSFIHHVKTSTSALHLRLESQALLAALMSPVVTRLQYYFYLTLMKKIEEVYENSIVVLLGDLFRGREQRRASSLIADDLSAIGDIAQQRFMLNEYTIPAEIISIPFALGFMYVMEGSKLGGKVIYKHIHRTLGYSESCGAKFIADNENDTSSLWKEFLSTFSTYVSQHHCEKTRQYKVLNMPLALFMISLNLTG